MEATMYVRSLDGKDVKVVGEDITVAQAHSRDRMRGLAYIQYLINVEYCAIAQKYSHDGIVKSALKIIKDAGYIKCRELLNLLTKEYVMSERGLHAHIRQMHQDGVIDSVGKTSRQEYFMTCSGYKLLLSE